MINCNPPPPFSCLEDVYVIDVTAYDRDRTTLTGETHCHLCAASSERDSESVAHATLANQPLHVGLATSPLPPPPQPGESSFPSQVGLDDSISLVSSFLTDLGTVGNTSVPDSLVQEIEGLVALFLAIQGTADYVSMSAVIFLYVRRHFTLSVTNTVMKYVSELFEYVPQTGTETQTESSLVVLPDWLKLMKTSSHNWKLARENPFFTQFSKLLGLLVTLGLCEASSLTFSIKEYELMAPDVNMIHGNALDIADAALSTVTFFIEGAYLSYQTGDLRPLLMSESEAYKLDEEYLLIIQWWDFVKNGNFKKVTGKEPQEFDKRLEALTTSFKAMISGKMSFEKKLLNDKFMRLLTIKNEFVTMRISSGVRKAPFAVELFGPSSQGKSTLTDQLMDALLASQDLDLGKENRGVINPNDDYMSGWYTYMTSMTLVDVCNTKPNFNSKNPCGIIDDVCSNDPLYANKADLASKGKVFVEPLLLIASTNKKCLDAGTYSNCPYSIQRRFHVVVTVRAKKQFQRLLDGKVQGIDSTKVRLFNETHNKNATFDDIWEVDLERAVQPDKLCNVARYGFITYLGKEMKSVSFSEAIHYLITQFAEHMLNQDAIIDAKEVRKGRVHRCNIDGCRQIVGYCPKHDSIRAVINMEPHFGDEFIKSASKACDLVSTRVSTDIFGMGTFVEGVTAGALLGAAKLFSKHWDWMTVIPTPWAENPNVQNVLLWCNQDKLKKNFVRRTIFMWATAGASIFFLDRKCLKASENKETFAVISATVALGCITRQKCMVNLVTASFRRELMTRNTVCESVKTIRDEHASTLCKAFAILGPLYAISRVYKRWREMNPQSALAPETPEEVEKRDTEVSVWSTMVTRYLPLPATLKSQCTTTNDLAGVVHKNLMYCTVHVPGKNYMGNGLFLDTNIVVIPNHYFFEDEINVTFRRDQAQGSGGTFKTVLAKATSELIPNTDLRICLTSNGGDFKNISGWLPTDNPPSTPFRMYWRQKEGEFTTLKGVTTPKLTGTTAAKFVGGEYKTLDANTFEGMCGATLISEGKGSCIIGFHLGGHAGTKKGCYGVCTKQQYDRAVEKVRANEGVAKTCSSGAFDPHILGVNVLTNAPLHPKSPLNFIPVEEGKTSQIKYFGSCPGGSTYRSDVKVTLISPSVIDVLGVPNIWGGPKMNPQWYGWQKCLSKCAYPADEFPYHLLKISVMDYKSKLLPIFRSNMWVHARPLTDEENLSGIPGCKFVDAIKLNTSIGYPLTGPKRNFVTETASETGSSVHRVLDDVIMTEIQRATDCWRRDEKAYMIAKACLKDEILEMSLDKCRVFFANPITLTWSIRKYFLPIARVLQMNPLVSECAVGINSYGPEWDEFYDHVLQHGEDRIIGGDYGKYDQKLPTQLIVASLRILIDFAKECDYTSDDLQIMEAMIGEIAHAYVAYNGDLIGLTQGTHISGNSLTVIINGICGSLNLRACYYAKYPAESFETRKDFRENVAVMTYGDDNIGSVKSGNDRFTIKTISQFLGSYGQTYTMPDKTSELKDYLPIEEFEFLKRKTVYHPSLGVKVGALGENSIFKMLHCYMRPKKSPLTKEQACALNVDTALREWFNHGETVYENRRIQMNEILELNELSHLSLVKDKSYLDLVDEWKQKYDEFYIKFDLEEDALFDV